MSGASMYPRTVAEAPQTPTNRRGDVIKFLISGELFNE